MTFPSLSRSFPWRLPITAPDFWRLWFVGTVLFIARWLDMLAMSVVIFQKTGSAFLVSLVIVARFLPMGMFGAFAGAFGDRFDRRKLIALLYASLLASSLTLLVLAHVDALEVWHMLAASFLAGIAATCDNPVRRMIVGEVVGIEKIGTAMAIDVATNNGTRTVGPFIAGALLASFGIEGVLLADTVVFAAALLAIARLDYRGQARAAGEASIIANIREGWRVCRTDRRLMGVLVLTIVFNLFAYPYVGLVPVIGASILSLGPAEIGLLASMDGLGSLIGALLIALFARQGSYQRIFVASIAAGIVSVFLFALTSGAFLAGSMLVAIGMAVAIFSVMQNTLMYLLAPAHARAWILGLLSVAIGINPLGFLAIGWLADAIGPTNALIVMSLAGMAVFMACRRAWWALVTHR